MDDKSTKSLEKWEGEIKTLESLRRYIRRFKKAKEDKDKEEMKKISDKVAVIFEENKWLKLEWKEIKRGKAALEEGIEKVSRRVDERKKKMIALGDELGVDLSEYGLKGKKKAGKTDRDWSAEIAACREGTEYYHWAYGKMQVIGLDEEYIYVKILDKKGCKHEWLNKGNVIVVLDEGEEEVKEFSRDSIGRWLFPESKDVKIINGETAHKTFAKQ